jgi:hypothetical protein
MACKKLRGLLVSEHEVLVLSPTAIWRLSAFRNWRCTKRTVTDGTRREFRSAGIYAFPLRSSQCCVACFDGNPVRMDLEKGTSETTVEDLLEQIHPDAGYASAACTSRMRAEAVVKGIETSSVANVPPELVVSSSLSCPAEPGCEGKGQSLSAEIRYQEKLHTEDRRFAEQHTDQPGRRPSREEPLVHVSVVTKAW